MRCDVMRCDAMDRLIQASKVQQVTGMVGDVCFGGCHGFKNRNFQTVVLRFWFVVRGWWRNLKCWVGSESILKSYFAYRMYYKYV